MFASKTLDDCKQLHVKGTRDMTDPPSARAGFGSLGPVGRAAATFVALRPRRTGLLGSTQIRGVKVADIDG